MKKIFLVIFLLLSCLIPSLYGIGRTQPIAEQPKLYDHYWSGTEDDLFLNLNLASGLRFSMIYYRLKVQDGLGCELSCQPEAGSKFLSAEGYPLDSVTFKIVMKNGASRDKVDYVLTVTNHYKQTHKDGSSIETKAEVNLTGTVLNPPLDLKVDPVFALKNHDYSKGMVSFNNVFPFSSINPK